MQTELTLFGGFALMCDGRLCSLGYERGKILLAWLVLHAGQPCSRAHLAELLWPEEPSGIARRRLREVLHRTRHALREEDRVRPLIQSSRSMIRLDAGDDLRCDVYRFDALMAAVDAHPHRQVTACLPCLDRLSEAVSLRTGAILAGVALPEGDAMTTLHSHRIARHEDVRRAMLTLGESALERGALNEALLRADQLCGLGEDDEPALCLRMRALASAGRRAEAVTAYTRFAAYLIAGDRPPPDDETEELYQSLVHGDYRTPPAHTALMMVPAPSTPLVGREAELRWLLEQLGQAAVRLITVVGLGGSGKTRLAIAAARKSAGSWQDGVWFVSAVDCKDTDALLLAILAALKLTLRSGLSARDGLLSWLAGREVLLVLDNIEQIPAAAQLIEALLAGAAGLRILATSRRRLGLRAEHRCPLAGLAPEAARTLWMSRARQLRPDLQAHPEDISALCSVLGTLPLAIEFSAAQVLYRSVPELLEALNSGLELQSAFCDVPTRQASMRHILECSIADLSPGLLRALGALAVFHGPLQPAAAAAICETPPHVLQTLQDHSLLSAVLPDRYVMLPIVSAFVRELRPPSAALRSAHRRWYLTERHRMSRDEGLADRDNLREAWRSAWRSSDLELLAACCYAFDRTLSQLSWLHDAAAWFTEAASALRQSHPEAAATRRCLACAGINQYRIGNAIGALSLLEEAEQAARCAEDTADLVRAMRWRAFVLRNLGQPATALSLLEEALTLPSATPEDTAQLRYIYACTLSEAGDTARARDALYRASAELRDVGATKTAALALTVGGLCAVMLGEVSDGLTQLSAATRALRPTGGMPLCDALSAWACACLIAGRIGEARHRARVALDGYQDSGFIAGIASASTWLSIALTAAGQAAEAAAAIETVIAIALQTGTDRARIEACCALVWWFAGPGQSPTTAAALIATVDAYPEPIAELHALLNTPRTHLTATAPLSTAELQQLLLQFRAPVISAPAGG